MEQPASTKDTLAAFVFHRRRSLGLSKEDLARAARVSVDSVDLLERGNSQSLPTGVLRSLAAPLGVSLVFLQRLADTERRTWPVRSESDRRRANLPVPAERRSGFDRRLSQMSAQQGRESPYDRSAHA